MDRCKRQIPGSGSAGRRRGFAAIYAVVALIALCGIVSLAVDFGRVQLAKSQLGTAADAAVRAAAVSLSNGVAQARQDAVSVAAANLCDGTAVALDTSADIEFGTWNTQTRTFTRLPAGSESDATAVRVTARRIASRNTAITLTFARVIGRNTCDIQAVAVATVASSASSGFTALNGFRFTNNTFVGSYNSGQTTSPTRSSASSHGALSTNGTISAGRNTTVQGDIHLGPSGSISGSIYVTGSTDRLSSPVDTPASPAWTPGANPAGIPQNYTVIRATTLPGGTYWFTSLNITASLSFSGPAVVYVNGNVVMDGDLTAAGGIPSNLQVHQLGTGQTFGDSNGNNASIAAVIEAPGSDCSFKNGVTFCGSALFGTITTRNSANFFCDEATAHGSGTTKVALVQ
jgi:Flp pilus assembly protein TadG